MRMSFGLPYFGSKSRIVNSYPPPAYDLIIEPFAGGAAYSARWLAERPSLRCVLYDIDTDVVDLWNCLLRLSPDQILRIPAPVPGTPVTHPLQSLVGTGSMDRKTVTSWSVQKWNASLRRIARTVAALHGRTEVRCADYSDVANIEATWFIDPPYSVEGRAYRFSSRSINYQRLASWCEDRRGQVIVCESANADWLPFRPIATARTMGSWHKDNTPFIEGIWVNNPDSSLFDVGAFR